MVMLLAPSEVLERRSNLPKANAELASMPLISCMRYLFLVDNRDILDLLYIQKQS